MQRLFTMLDEVKQSSEGGHDKLRELDNLVRLKNQEMVARIGKYFFI